MCDKSSPGLSTRKDKNRDKMNVMPGEIPLQLLGSAGKNELLVINSDPMFSYAAILKDAQFGVPTTTFFSRNNGICTENHLQSLRAPIQVNSMKFHWHCDMPEYVTGARVSILTIPVLLSS